MEVVGGPGSKVRDRVVDPWKGTETKHGRREENKVRLSSWMVSGYYQRIKMENVCILGDERMQEIGPV